MAIIGSLGSIIFEVSDSVIRSFGEYSDSVSARLGEHEPGGARPVGEFIGPGARAISIPITLNASLGVYVEQDIATAQEYAEKCTLLTLVIGRQPVGPDGAQWLLEGVETNRREFNSIGAAIVADLTLNLKLARDLTTPLPVSSTIKKQNTTRVKS